MLPEFLSSLLGSAATVGDFFKAAPGALVVGTLIWKVVRRPDCRLVPVEQGVGWWQLFHPGTDWIFKAKVRNDGIPADKVSIEFTLVEVSDSHERVVMTRRPAPIDLGPMRVPLSDEERIRIGGGRREERKVDASNVNRLRVKGSVTSRTRFGLPRRRRFDLYMDRDGSYRGTLRERA